MSHRADPRLPLVFGLGAVLIGCDSEEASGDKGTQVAVYPGCENAGAVGVIPSTGGVDAGAPSIPVKDEQSLFEAAIAPNLSSCRPCHVGGGLADVEGGRGFLLTSDPAQDYDTLKSSWTALGGGVDANPILTKAAGTDAEGHSGGALWKQGSSTHDDLKLLLSCWNDPSGCSAGIASRATPDARDQYPLLGDLEANGGRNYAAVYCEEKPDCASLPIDPRELIAGDNIDNPSYAVWYNDPFEICETDALFENQKRGNDILISQGKEPAYTAKPRPKNCGEWRTAVDRGREYVLHNALTGPVMHSTQTLLNVATYLKMPVSGSVEDINSTFASLSLQRYGWVAAPFRNPAPMPGEDPNATDGGSLQLPLALTQIKDKDGKWTGQLGMTCFSCHMGQIGTGEVVGNSAARDGHPQIYGGTPQGTFVGANGSNTDPGLALWDTDQANGLVGPDAFTAVIANPGYLMNRTRGVQAADQAIASTLFFARDPDTLDWLNPNNAADKQGKLTPTPLLEVSGGDQDEPTWWWTHNKTRYLWVALGSSGSARGNFFPGTVNNQDGHWSKRREGDFQDMDVWLNSVEAPKFVGPAVDIPLAEQGALLFHAKDLWADPLNSDIPRPPGGNGSCASCHGAYSPKFIHQPGYLPDPRLAGMTGYTVSLDILRTDSAQSDAVSFLFGGVASRQTTDGPAGAWMGYPDAIPGYLMPEERSPGQSAFPPGSVFPERQCGLGALGGYTAQPLHGVWASGPYFHNGSVPTVWDILKPEDRPDIWQRQQIPESEATPGLGYRGFDTNLTRAYDYEKLGWKYTAHTCSTDPGASYYQSCKPADLSADPGIDAKSVDDRTIYNTNAYSKSNAGHEWTKVLTDDERRALIEYLKTL
jgi:endo-cleaving rubber dioxygenase